MQNSYDYTSDDLVKLLIEKAFPERTQRESEVIREWLKVRGRDYDRFMFSVRVGQGDTPDPSHLPAVQQQTIFNSRKRIDVLAFQGPQPTIIEVKYRVQPSALGQIQTYRHLWLEENPDGLEPRLVVIGRYSDDDTLRAIAAHGVDVLLYPEAAPLGDATAGGV